LVDHDLSMRILCRFYGWLIFAGVIALFMFAWPYVRSHILCTQLVIYLLSHFIHIWYLDWPWSEHAGYYTDFMDGWFISRVIAIFMFVWPYVRSHILSTQLVIYLLSHFIHIGILVGHDLNMRILYRFHGWLIFASHSPFPVCLTIHPSHILCTQLVICLLSHFIHIWYLGWPWFEHVHIIPILQMVDLCKSYSPFHVCLTIRPSAHLVYATSHLSFFVAFYSYLVSWLAMIWACTFYTDFTDGWYLRELLAFSCLFDHMSVCTSCVRN
jgi:hypothetical protein